MFDLKLDKSGDLQLTADGDVLTTESICQAVRIRLLWFFDEWRLGPDLGFRYFEDVFVKNPSESKIKHLIRETVMSVDGVTDVESIEYVLDKRTRSVDITVIFCTDEETFREEVNIQWQNTD